MCMLSDDPRHARPLCHPFCPPPPRKKFPSSFGPLVKCLFCALCSVLVENTCIAPRHAHTESDGGKGGAPAGSGPGSFHTVASHGTSTTTTSRRTAFLVGSSSRSDARSRGHLRRGAGGGPSVPLDQHGGAPHRPREHTMPELDDGGRAGAGSDDRGRRPAAVPRPHRHLLAARAGARRERRGPDGARGPRDAGRDEGRGLAAAGQAALGDAARRAAGAHRRGHDGEALRRERGVAPAEGGDRRARPPRHPPALALPRRVGGRRRRARADDLRDAPGRGRVLGRVHERRERVRRAAGVARLHHLRRLLLPDRRRPHLRHRLLP